MRSSPVSASGLPAPTAIDTRDLVDLLHTRGQRATPQRLVVLRELRRRGHHTTADGIRRAVRRDLPGTSTPTVYATLELLVELGLARRIDAGTGATLYDPRTEPHPHLTCRRCGAISDLECPLDVTQLQAAAGDAGFDAQEIDVVVSGVCASCRRG
jgi:Fe2+ or Zn2+ uptake regulation protein